MMWKFCDAVDFNLSGGDWVELSLKRSFPQSLEPFASGMTCYYYIKWNPQSQNHNFSLISSRCWVSAAQSTGPRCCRTFVNMSHICWAFVELKWDVQHMWLLDWADNHTKPHLTTNRKWCFAKTNSLQKLSWSESFLWSFLELWKILLRQDSVVSLLAEIIVVNIESKTGLRRACRIREGLWN